MPQQLAVDPVDWFDVHNSDHLLAYRHLCAYGAWPSNFAVPEIMPPYWQALLAAKMSDAWLMHKIGTRVPLKG